MPEVMGPGGKITKLPYTPGGKAMARKMAAKKGNKLKPMKMPKGGKSAVKPS